MIDKPNSEVFHYLSASSHPCIARVGFVSYKYELIIRIILSKVCFVKKTYFVAQSTFGDTKALLDIRLYPSQFWDNHQMFPVVMQWVIIPSKQKEKLQSLRKFSLFSHSNLLMKLSSSSKSLQQVLWIDLFHRVDLFRVEKCTEKTSQL